MATKTLSVLESSLADAYTWVNEIDDELGYDDKHFALQALRGGLHALRDRLTIDLSAHLSAQLPLLIRGIYFENWNPEPLPSRDRSLDGFLERMTSALRGYDDLNSRAVVGAVFRVLERHISLGEDLKIANVLPHEIAAIWDINMP
jgi:uncharacterized protein (DUF2267 family)